MVFYPSTHLRPILRPLFSPPLSLSLSSNARDTRYKVKISWLPVQFRRGPPPKFSKAESTFDTWPS